MRTLGPASAHSRGRECALAKARAHTHAENNGGMDGKSDADEAKIGVNIRDVRNFLCNFAVETYNKMLKKRRI